MAEPLAWRYGVVMTAHRTLGASDLQVSAVGIGCNAFGARIDQEPTTAVVEAALEAGINFFDTSDTYGRGNSEQMLGVALGTRRQDVVIATKFGMTMHGANGDEGARAAKPYMRRALEASLRRLGTDYIDLYQLHTPDRVTPFEDTIAAMNELVDEGKVRAIGCSNLTAAELRDANEVAGRYGFEAFVTAQNEYSLYNRVAEEQLVPACQELGVSLLPYFPLAYGLLTGKYRRGRAAPEGSRLERQSERLANADFDVIEALAEFATQRDIDLLTLSIGGLAAQPAVGSVISGVTRADQVWANTQAVSWQPSSDDLAQLATIRGIDGSYTSFAPA